MDQMESRLKLHYRDHVAPALTSQFGYGNPHQIPRVTKVVLNVGVGEASKNQKLLDSVVEELGIVSGQRPVVTGCRSGLRSRSGGRACTTSWIGS